MKRTWNGAGAMVDGQMTDQWKGGSTRGSFQRKDALRQLSSEMTSGRQMSFMDVNIRYLVVKINTRRFRIKQEATKAIEGRGCSPVWGLRAL